MKKVYKFGDVLITANFKDVWSCPDWSKEPRPEYNITLTQLGNANKFRHSVKAWGNLANNPDEQHLGLAGLVLDEHLRDPENYTEFCSNYGYEEDSRKAFKIWQTLVRCYDFGKWVKLAKKSPYFKSYEAGEELETLLADQTKL